MAACCSIELEDHGLAASPAPQVSQGEQGLSRGGEKTPARPDPLLSGLQPPGQEPQDAMGHIDRGWVYEHAKLRAGTGDLGRDPSIRSFAIAQACPARGQHRQFGKGSMSDLGYRVRTVRCLGV